jgi:hypothetical protein
MRGHFAILTVAGLASAASADLPPLESYDAQTVDTVRRIPLPPGVVKWENVRTKDGMIVRVTAGQVVVEGKHLFYGDGKVAMEVEAMDKGMQFLRVVGSGGWSESSGTLGVRKGFVIDGTRTEGPRAVWFLDADHLKADELKPGSIYLITPSVKFEYKPQRKP